jgi:uncharacterized iron-regulated membrane protein
VIIVPQSAGQPAVVQLALPEGQRPPRGAGQNFVAGVRYVDPVSLEILEGNEIPRNGPVMRIMTMTHIALMAPAYYGMQTVGWMGVAMCLFGITGLVLWWPAKGMWRQAFWIKWRAHGFRLNRDLQATDLVADRVHDLSVSGVYLASRDRRARGRGNRVDGKRVRRRHSR